MRNKKVILQVLLCFVLVLGLILAASVDGASPALARVADERLIACPQGNNPDSIDRATSGPTADYSPDITSWEFAPGGAGGGTGSSNASFDEVGALGISGVNPKVFIEGVGGTGFDFASSITQPKELSPLFAVAGCWEYDGVFDGFVAQFDVYGDLAWAKGLGSPAGVDNAISVIEASDGGYVVTGDIDLGSGGGGERDLFIAKFARDKGKLVWGKTFGGNGWDRGLSLVETLDHGFVVSGVTTSVSLGAVGWDVLLAKFGSDGAFVWAARLDGGGDEIGHSVIEGSDAGDLFVTGWTSSFGNNMDILLARFDSAGILRWAKAYGGGEEDVGDTVFGGKFAVLGGKSQYSSALFVSGYTTSPGAGNKDAFIAKFALDGKLEWAKRLGGKSDDWGTGIAFTMPHLLSGFQLVVGPTLGITGGTMVITGATESFGAGGEDVFLAAFDYSDGGLKWARTFGGPANEGGFSVKQALVETPTGGGICLPAGRLFMAGYTFSDGWRSGPEDALISTFDPYGYSSSLVRAIQPDVSPFTPPQTDGGGISTAPRISTGFTLTNDVANYVYDLKPDVKASPISDGLIEYTDIGDPNVDVTFSFAIITDNHIHTPPDHTQLDDVVDWIVANKAAEKIKFVILSGDISDEGYRCIKKHYTDVAATLQPLNTAGVPYVPLTGDHDVYYDRQGGEPTGSQDGRPEELFNAVFSGQYADFKQQLGIPNSSWDKEPTPRGSDYFQNFAFDYGGFHFICLDSVSRSDIDKRPEEARGWPDLQQGVTDGTWDWFTEHLSAYVTAHPDSDENILIFTHHPLSYCDGLLSAGIPFVVPPLPLAFKSSDYATIVSYTQTYEANIAMWFSGHLHIPLEEDINANPTDNSGSLVLQTVGTTSVSPNVPPQMQQVISVNPFSPALRIVRVHQSATGKCNLTVASTAGGTVSAPGDGTFTYDEGTVVNLVAEPDEGYRFVNWTGDVDTIADVDDATTTITMNGEYSITANFKSGCFIATAVYGTPMAEEIRILREFRDAYLLTNPVGRALANLYYSVSPPIAQFITENPGLKPIVRAGLVPAVVMSTVAVNATPVEKAVTVGSVVLVSVALAVWATRRRGTRMC